MTQTECWKIAGQWVGEVSEGLVEEVLTTDIPPSLINAAGRGGGGRHTQDPGRKKPIYTPSLTPIDFTSAP